MKLQINLDNILIESYWEDETIAKIIADEIRFELQRRVKMAIRKDPRLKQAFEAVKERAIKDLTKAIEGKK